MIVITVFSTNVILKINGGDCIIIIAYTALTSSTLYNTLGELAIGNSYQGLVSNGKYTGIDPSLAVTM